MHVVGAARYFECDPAILTERQIGDFLLFLRNERKYASSSMAQTIVALRTFFRDHLKQSWDLWKTVRVRHVESLPLVLTREEVAAVLAQPKRHFFQVLFRLTYHCGMRLGEVIRLAPYDLDEAAGRIHIRFAKGGKPRYVPATPEMFAEVHRFYLRHNNPLWLFPGLGRGWKHLKISLVEATHRSKSHISEAAVQNAFRLCVQESGIGKAAHLHTLRHCYATHLLEEGVSIRLISQYMGHASLNPTIIYTHLTAVSEEQTREALARLHKQSHSK